MFSSAAFFIAGCEKKNKRKKKGKRVIAGILLVGIIAVTLTGVNIQTAVKKRQKSRSLRSAATTILHTII